MRRLTQQELEDVFLAAARETLDLSLYWTISHWARQHSGIELRTALRQVRRETKKMSIFIDKILHASDLDDVVYVIDVLASEIGKGDLPGTACLSLLQAWRARTLMQSVIDKRTERITCAG